MQSQAFHDRWGSFVASARSQIITASESLLSRSRSLVAFLDVRIEALIPVWIGTTVVLGIVKVALAPQGVGSMSNAVGMLMPYLLVAMSPIVGYRVAAGSFPRGLLSAQPFIRLARFGSWRQVDPVAARNNPGFGPFGFMASLLVGILLNVPIRTAEYLLAIPALGSGAPDWADRLLLITTIDVIVMNFFYMVCFVMAVRAVPLFPRMLLFAWAIDAALQLAIARYAAGSDLPVGVIQALESLIEGNLQKVMISAAVWLPYLILSDRVNLTYRQRLRDGIMPSQ